MKLMIISGSQRAHSKSLLTAQYLSSLAAESGFKDSSVLDLHALNLPLWNEDFWQKDSESWSCWQPVKAALKEADAFILITPEWHGMATPALKNFLLLTTDQEMAHKPALLASVSASVNGVYPISELRMTGSKNNHVCFLPDHLIFRDIETLLDDELNCHDARFDERARYTMKLLSAYAQALAPVHEGMPEEGAAFRYGM
ncbi:NADPH-dependent FMN reductase [Vibrio quintilis]|uniref:FMN-dependent NADPH-azoreductase n=1 Tax=Vibrio quintilis TaxID=1117707 RepID=A0A1M7Z229_9VIBR|nr:NAD(P)H-dependent oxidoreductase [Vibrio quintilis]SHO59019.1 FMN-dependent NADPH-azoreductase [Vibrio quintilis]